MYQVNFYTYSVDTNPYTHINTNTQIYTHNQSYYIFTLLGHIKRPKYNRKKMHRRWKE